MSYWLPYSNRGEQFETRDRAPFALHNPSLPAFVREGDGLFWGIVRHFARAGASVEMIAVQVAAFVSLLTQGQADAEWPNGQRINIGASGFTVGVSNSGKSAIFRELVEVFEQFMAAHATGGDQDPDFFIGDATRESLIDHLNNWRFAALFSDDAGNLMQMFKQAAPTLATALDGAPLRHSRVSTGRIHLHNYRVVLYLGLQPDYVTPQWLLKTSTSGAGTTNRMLFSRALEPLLGGNRALLTLPPELKQPWWQKADLHLHAVARNALGKPAPLPLMRLSREAKYYMEALIADGAYSSTPSLDACPAAYRSRHPERVLRFSGSIEVFENGVDNEISLESVISADALCQMSLDAFRGLTYIAPTLSRTERDALLLHQKLVQTAVNTGVTSFERAALRRFAPNMGLTAQRVEKALPLLVDDRKAWITGSGKTDYVQLLCVLPVPSIAW